MPASDQPSEKKDIAVLLDEKRIFNPSDDLVKQSNVWLWMKKHGIKDLQELLARSQDIEWFWSEMAKEVDITWAKPYDKVLEWDLPWSKWYVGAEYNIVVDAIDKHASSARKDKLAYIWEGEPEGEVRKLTYFDLYQEVNRLANGLKSLGIKKGDRVSIYLPMIPELPIAMLACAKIGAIHSVVFSGFSALALRDRIVDCESNLVITCDSFYRRGKTIPLKAQTDEAIDAIKDTDWTGSPTHVVVFRRTGEDVPWTDDRDLWWHELTAPQSPECDTEILDANDTLYLLYTSGTTGKPKGVIHAAGGYAVGIAATLKWIFDLKEDDTWWCAADIGWVTGHSYIVYAPLMLGVTSIIYEGAPTYPDPGRWWRIVDRYGVTVFYTSPTAIRLFMRYGEKALQGCDLKSLRLLGTVGEPINPEAWIWYWKYIGKERIQIMDTWWQTETGQQLITPLPITPLKPGSATFPFPGVTAAVLDETGNSIQGAGGALVLSNPWPAMLRGLWGEPERYKATYWMRYDGVYLTGDIARRDADGYYWIQGRADDVLSVAGHRIGNSEVESALVSHPMVAESAVIGKPHEIKGESITAFVVLREGVEISEELRNTLKEHVSVEIGKIARPDEILFVRDVPKTRSGKIMRRVIRSSALGQPVGDISTLSNPEAVEEIAAAL